MKYFTILLYFIFAFYIPVFAQETPVITVEKSENIQVINGKKFYLHVIKKGQTLYTLSKAYEVSVDEIVKDNPEISKSPIYPAQILKIAYKEKTLIINNTVEKKDSFINYTVNKKETVYSISRKFNISEEELLNANSTQNMNLQTGQVIKIPYVKDTITEKKKGFLENIFKKQDKQTTEEAEEKPLNKENTEKKKEEVIINEAPKMEELNCSPAIRNEQFNIGLFLPLELSEISDIILDEEEVEKLKPPTSYKSFNYIQFYEGFMIALDSLKEEGLNAKVYVYDLFNDTINNNQLLKKPEMKSLNLIICPVMKSAYKGIVRFSKNNNIKFVTYSNHNITQNNYYEGLFLLNPAMEEQCNQISGFIKEKFNNENIIIIYQGNNNKETKSAEKLKKVLNANSIDITKTGNYGINSYLNDKTNVLISFINDELIVSKYISHLNNMRDKYKIILFCNPKWENIPSVDKMYLMNLNMHSYSSTFIDYEKESVKHFIGKFRNEYKTEPNLQAYMGYDSGFYFGNALLKWGKDFDKCLNEIETELLITNLKFKKTSNNLNQNSELNIYEYSDFKAIKIK